MDKPTEPDQRPEAPEVPTLRAIRDVLVELMKKYPEPKPGETAPGVNEAREGEG